MRKISIAHKSLDPSLSYSIAFVIEPSMGVIGSDGLKENSSFRGPVDRRNSERKEKKVHEAPRWGIDKRSHNIIVLEQDMVGLNDSLLN